MVGKREPLQSNAAAGLLKFQYYSTLRAIHHPHTNIPSNLPLSKPPNVVGFYISRHSDGVGSTIPLESRGYFPKSPEPEPTN